MKKKLQVIIDWVFVLTGSAIGAFSMNLFLIPYQIAPGGASGLSLVINHVINGVISTGILIIIINIPLFVISFKTFGKKFVFKSIAATLIFSTLVDVLKPAAESLGQRWFLFQEGTGNTDLLLFAVYGGVMLGVGFGLVIRAGASTGGSDLGAQLLNRVFPGITTGTWMLFLDAIVVILAAVAFKNVIYSLYSIIVIWICSSVIDVIVGGINHAKAVYIISDEHEKIKEKILFGLKRGVTTLVGRGAYSGAEKNVLLCVVQHSQVHELKRIVSEVDNKAFIVLSDAKEVLGEGFRREKQ